MVGAGASGLMAAIAAAEAGAEVTVLEHMPRAGKKLLSTGNGKCNLTNLKLSAGCYRSGDPKFPMAVIGLFSVPETLLFFRRLGVVTRDRNGYVYPASGQAQTVLDALKNRAEQLGVWIVAECGREAFYLDGRKVYGEDFGAASENFRGVTADGGLVGARRAGGGFSRFLAVTEKGSFHADFLILSTGSMAAKNTGSDGSGYGIAKAFGHKVNTPLPALVQLRCRGSFFKALAGVRTEGRVSLYEGKKNGRFLAADEGEIQLTEYGISGIPVFQVSRFASEALFRGRAVTAVLDFFPSLSGEELRLELMRQKQFLAGSAAEEFLNGFFHKKLAAVLLKQAGIGKERLVDSLTEREISGLARLIKEFEVTVEAVNSYDQAQVCMGGVEVREIDPQTMESRLVPGLYLCGELVDVDGICGGYNLQWAWSSGYVAGCAAAASAGRFARGAVEPVTRSVAARETALPGDGLERGMAEPAVRRPNGKFAHGPVGAAARRSGNGSAHGATAPAGSKSGTGRARGAGRVPGGPAAKASAGRRKKAAGSLPPNGSPAGKRNGASGRRGKKK